MAKECPVCRLLNPDTSEVCDCGHHFALDQTATQSTPERWRMRTIGRAVLERGAAVAVVVLAAVVLLPLFASESHARVRSSYQLLSGFLEFVAGPDPQNQFVVMFLLIAVGVGVSLYVGRDKRRDGD